MKLRLKLKEIELEVPEKELTEEDRELLRKTGGRLTLPRWGKYRPDQEWKPQPPVDFEVKTIPSTKKDWQLLCASYRGALMAAEAKWKADREADLPRIYADIGVWLLALKREAFSEEEAAEIRRMIERSIPAGLVKACAGHSWHANLRGVHDKVCAQLAERKRAEV
jgi:hypothetical protein